MPLESKNEKLKQRIIEGDPSALDQLYRENFKLLVQYGMRFNPQVPTFSIQDIVQDIFIWIAQNRHKLKKINNIEVYLFSSLKKNIFSEIKKNKSKQNSKNNYLASHLKYENEIEDSVESKIINTETSHYNKNKIAQLISNLPKAQQEVIYLRNFVNLEYKEISKIMNLSEQVVRNYSYRAMQKLRIKAANNNDSQMLM